MWSRCGSQDRRLPSKQRRRRGPVLFGQDCRSNMSMEPPRWSCQQSRRRTGKRIIDAPSVVDSSGVSSRIWEVSAATAALCLCLESRCRCSTWVLFDQFSYVGGRLHTRKAPEWQPTTQRWRFHFKQHNHYYRFQCFYSPLAIESISFVRWELGSRTSLSTSSTSAVRPLHGYSAKFQMK